MPMRPQPSDGPDLGPPSLLDPRVIILVPAAQRGVMTSLWRLDTRLGAMVRAPGEAALKQIKLAWWRDALSTLNSAGGRGEPLLTELADHAYDAAALAALTDAWEMALFAVDDAEWRDAAAARGRTLFSANGVDDVAAGQHWALVDFALASGDAAERLRLINLATTAYAPVPDLPRALRALSAWSDVIARAKGERRPAKEGMALLRVGIFGR